MFKWKQVEIVEILLNLEKTVKCFVLYLGDTLYVLIWMSSDADVLQPGHLSQS